MSTIRVAVTGATGFLGSAIVTRLRRLDDVEVRAYPSRGPDGLDIRDRRALKNAFQHFRPDVVINAAGLAHANASGDLSQLFAVNAYGPENVVHEAGSAGARKVIHLGSVMVYGHGKAELVSESSEANPEDDYARSKFLGDQAASDAAERAGIGLVILRLSMIPNAKNQSNLSDLIRAVKAKRFLWVGSGANRKSLLTLSDTVRAVEKILASQISPGIRVFNLCSETLTMSEIVSEIEKGTRVAVPKIRIPVALARPLSALLGGHLGVPPADRLRKFLSSDIISGGSIQKELGFRYEGGVRDEIRRAAEELEMQIG